MAQPYDHEAGKFVSRCGCDSCKAHRAEKERGRQAARLAMRTMKDGKPYAPVLPDGLQHGMPRAYFAWGCRCEDCSAAGAAKAKQRTAGKQTVAEQPAPPSKKYVVRRKKKIDA